MVKVCVAGADEGEQYARVLNRLNALAGVYDADEDKARTFGRSYGVQYYASLEDMLASKPDGVVVTAMNSRMSIISTIIAKCKNILVTRPLGCSFRECREIVEAARRSKAMLIPVYLDRFNPIINRAREVIAGKRYGSALMLEIQGSYSYSSSSSDGGMLYNVVDDVYAAVYLLNASPDVVFAREGMNGMAIATVLGFREGNIACITCSKADRGRSIIMVMEDGTAVACYPARQEMHIGSDVIRESGDPMTLALNNFIDVIEDRDEPKISALDALIVEKIADAVMLSSRLGSQVYIAYE